MATSLSDHFTLEELVYSETAERLGVDNSASPEIVDNLTHLCEVALEPLRELWGVPVKIDSGYRCPELNHDVHGVYDSEHLFGHAADCIPQGLNLRDAFDTAKDSNVPYDQIIIEENLWVHVGLAADGVTPRREALIAVGTPGHWTYQKVD